MIRRLAAAALGLAIAACGEEEIPEPLPRVLGASPEGEGVPTTSIAEIRFGAPVDPSGLTDGRLLVLVRADAVRDAVAAVESDAGAAGLAGAVAVDASIEDAGARVALRPKAPLRAFTGHALVLSSRVHAADGRQMLDPLGRRRTFVAPFGTGAPDGPPPVLAITEVLARAATPQAGGEYAELANLGEGPVDLAGFRLAKRSATGTLLSCELVPPLGTVLAPGAVAIAAGGAWDGRYALPAETQVLACGAKALLGGIADDRPPDLLLEDPGGNVLATFGEAGGPLCPLAAEKADPAGPDAPDGIVCTDGSPGVLPWP